MLAQGWLLSRPQNLNTRCLDTGCDADAMRVMPAEAELVGALAHERDDVGDVLVERQADLLGARAQIVAADGAARRPCPSSA